MLVDCIWIYLFATSMPILAKSHSVCFGRQWVRVVKVECLGVPNLASLLLIIILYGRVTHAEVQCEYSINIVFVQSQLDC